MLVVKVMISEPNLFRIKVGMGHDLSQCRTSVPKESQVSTVQSSQRRQTSVKDGLGSAYLPHKDEAFLVRVAMCGQNDIVAVRDIPRN